MGRKAAVEQLLERSSARISGWNPSTVLPEAYDFGNHPWARVYDFVCAPSAARRSLTTVTGPRTRPRERPARPDRRAWEAQDCVLGSLVVPFDSSGQASRDRSCMG